MSHSLHRLRNLVLDSYIDAHPDLRELYHTDSITNQVMQQCACTGLAPVVSFFVPPGSTPAPKS